MQIDVNVNMTFEVDEDEWNDYLEMEKEDNPKAKEKDILFSFVTDGLEGEEVQTYQGRAWICAVDKCSILDS